MNIYDSLTKWLSENYLTQTDTDRINFNAMKNEINNTSVMSENVGLETINYNDGSRRITMPFQVSMVKAYDTEQSDTNIDGMSKASEFIDWIRAQNDIANYPDLGDDVCVEELLVENEVPDFLVSTDGTLANYVVNCKIIYLVEK
jgi:hypothetical protein